MDEPKDEKKDKVRSRKKFIVIAIIAILVVAGVFYLVIWLLDDSIKNLHMGTVQENADHTGIKVMAFADSEGGASVEGNGRVRIIFNDEEVYEGKLNFNNGEANKEIGFEDFVVGNGDYTVELSYGNKKDSDILSINWVTEYIYIEPILSDTKLNGKGEVVKGKLTLPITALNADTIFLFSLPGNIKTDLNNNIISQSVIDGFDNNHRPLSDETDANKLLKMNDDEWMILSNLERYLLKDEGSQFAVHDTKGLMEKPKNVEVECSIYYEGNKVHTDTITLNDASITIDGYDYHSTGAGEYRFEIEAKNTMIKQDSSLYEGYVSASLSESLNQEPVAALTKGSDFSYDGEKNEQNPNPTYHYEKTIHITSSEAKDGYEINFDASYSFNDGALTHEWDWEYVNDWETDMTDVTFDVDDTGAIVTHTFYPDINLIHLTDDLYLGLRVEGDIEIDVTGADGSKHKELESNIKIIHLEFIYTL